MDTFIPKLYYCLLVSHKTVIEGDYTEAIEVPMDVKQVQLSIPTFNGTPATAEQVWRELNSQGYYSYQYKLTNYWQPILEDQQPF